MIRFYKHAPPAQIEQIDIGGVCPHCKQGSRWTITVVVDLLKLNQLKSKEFTANYTCELCARAIPVLWEIVQWNGLNVAAVGNPRLVLRSVESFDYEHVPEPVQKEIKEALDCLSVTALNGFAALCRRAVQSICTDLGAEGSSKVDKQIKEMADLTGLDEGGRELIRQIMLTGHDGAHPHLPEVGMERARILLSLLQDLTYQLYTRPGKVRDAAQLRRNAIEPS